MKTKGMTFLAALIAAAFPAVLNAQSMSGTVYDASTGEPVPYVNIGVTDSETGTVSGADGRYRLEIPDELHGRTLRFSCIGYGDFDVNAGVFLQSGGFDVRLQPALYEIGEVSVRAGKYKTRVLGNDFRSPAIGAAPAPGNRGYEIGVVMKTRKRVILDKASINITKCDSPEMIFRLNIYSVTADGGFENVLTEPIYDYFYMTDEPRTLEIDLTPYDIVLEGDFMVAIQHIDENEGKITLPSGFTGARSVHRGASQGEWQDFIGRFPISVTVLQQK